MKVKYTFTVSHFDSLRSCLPVTSTCCFRLISGTKCKSKCIGNVSILVDIVIRTTVLADTSTLNDNCGH
jgi:hypothetical protein